MKRIIVLFIALLGFNSMEAQKVKYGIKAGLNIANLNIDQNGFPSTSSVANVHAGFFAEMQLSKKVAFQPELLYSAQGAKFDYLIDDGEGLYSTENTFKLAYLNVPLMIKYYPESKLFLEAGPQVGFLTSARLKTKVIGYGASSRNADDAFKNIDFGFNVGAGYNFSKHVTANARYNFGLSNIAEKDPGESVKVKNSVFSLSLGYIF